MGFRIGTNVASMAAQRNLARSESMITHASRALSSGSRIVYAGDDAANFAISESLRGQAASLRQAKRNAESAQGLIQVAESGLNEQNNILVRMRELAVQAASDTVGEDERGFIDTEFQNLVQEFDRIAQTTRYSNKPLLMGGSQNYEFHLGTGTTTSDYIGYKLDTDTRASSVNIADLAVTEKEGARDTLDVIDEAMKKVATARSSFGAMQSRLDIAANNLGIQNENVEEARSRLADADVAEEVSKLTKGKILHEFGVSILAQANQAPQNALRLLV